MDKNHLLVLSQYFEKNVYNPQEERRILLDKLKGIDMFKVLYPRGIDENQKRRRRSVLHLYLWDTYYSFSQTQDAAQESLEKWWLENAKEKIEDVLACLEENDAELSKLIFNIVKRWACLRDKLFCEDWEDLKKCHTKNDYERFVEERPYTYLEYKFYARYKISELADSVFEEASEAIKEFPDSDWIKDLRLRCCTTASGITYMISKELYANCEEKDIIMAFFEDFVKAETGNHNIIMMCKNLITERLWNVVMKQSMVFRSNLSIPKLMTFEEAEGFIKNLRHLVCVKLRMPTVEEWEKCACAGYEDHLFSGGNEIEEVAVYADNSSYSLQEVHSKKPNKLGVYDMSGNAWEWCQSESEESSVAAIKGGDFTSPREWCEISATKYVPKSCYAGCRLVLDC